MLLWQLDSCLIALHRARGESNATRMRYDISERAVFTDHQQPVADFQSALTFASNVSKMLWPRIKEPVARKRGLARAKRLRRLLQIRRRDGVIYRVPDIRNNFEHLDERIDVWSERTAEGVMGVHALTSDRGLMRVDKGDRWTRYNPDNDTFKMLNHKVDLAELERRLKHVRYASVGLYRAIQRHLSKLEAEGLA